MRRIILARHGQTEWNLARRFQGKTDIPLNETGKEQAQALAERLSSWPLEAVYSSPLSRALYTASAVAERHGLTPSVLLGLREIDFASWEGKSIPILQEQGKFALWRRDPFFNPPPGAETWEEIRSRVAQAVEAILVDPCERVAVVSHGGVTRALYAVLLGLDPHEVWNLDFSNCAMSGIELRSSGPCLVFANDDLHIRAGNSGKGLPVW